MSALNRGRHLNLEQISGLRKFISQDGPEESAVAKTWGDVFNSYKRQGHDPSSAALKADEWEARQRKARS